MEHLVWKCKPIKLQQGCIVLQVRSVGQMVCVPRILVGSYSECEIGLATVSSAGQFQKGPDGSLLMCVEASNWSTERTREFQVFGDSAEPEVQHGVEAPLPTCNADKPTGRPLIASEKITLEPGGTVGSINQSCFALKPEQKLKAAYCVMSDKDGEGKCVTLKDCDIGEARVSSSIGPIIENGQSYQCVQAINSSKKVRQFQIFGE